MRGCKQSTWLYYYCFHEKELQQQEGPLREMRWIGASRRALLPGASCRGHARVPAPSARGVGAAALAQHRGALVSFMPAPKPLAKFRAEKFTKAWWDGVREQQRAAKEKAIAKARAQPRKVRTPLPRSTKRLPAVNVRRQTRRRANYRKVLASDFHKRLRYRVWERSGGLCECSECSAIRGGEHEGHSFERVAAAHRSIEVWFTKAGGEPWKRFRCSEAETHHVSYALFGDENDDELRLVLFVWKECHRRIEATFGTRRRFLKGARS